ncbi:MAG TPA: hypothetical protein VFE10_11210 [Phenylobacterium sp.]|jgi:hypothetical protein|nr:hypothetical protein [Phenylobacterium sp.]
MESCTALVEHPDGRLEILDWPRVRASLAAAPAPLGLPQPLAA